MIDIDFTSGFQAIQNKGVHYRFAFADLSRYDADEIETAAAKIIGEFTEIDISGMHTTFIRDGSNGEIYAVAFISSDPRSFHAEIKFPEGREHFLRQFPDWVVIESEDAYKYELNFIDMVHGWLPDHRGMIKKCFESQPRAKSKNTIIKKWEHGNNVLTFSGATDEFRLAVVHGAMRSEICIFYANEIFKNPAEQ